MQQQKRKSKDRDGRGHDGHRDGDIQCFDDKRLLHSRYHAFLRIETTSETFFARVVFQTCFLF